MIGENSPALGVNVGRVDRPDGFQLVGLTVALGTSATFVVFLQPDHADVIAKLLLQEAAIARKMHSGQMIASPGSSA